MAIYGAILDKYQELGGASGFLGSPTTDQKGTPDGIGSYVHFRRGSIYWSPNTGAHLVHGDIRDKWASLGWEKSFLGYPITDESSISNGWFNHFQGGSIYSSADTGTYTIYGAIRDKWASLGWENSFLGYPTTDEKGTPDGIGRYNHFQNRGSIYWTPNTGAHVVHGDIRDKWASLGWEKSFLGYPVTDMLGTSDGIGLFNNFQGGSIYWTPNTGAHTIYGDIFAKWASLGWENSFLGYPTTDELGTPDRIGRFNHFEKRGSIYWTPNTGAHVVHGDIRDKWASLGWEKSFLGYPVTDMLGTSDGIGLFNNFQGGSIYWTPNTGAHEIHGDIRDKWASLGWENSFLGYPTTDELGTPDGIGRFNHFQGGSIYWTPNTGAHEIHGDILSYWANQGYEQGSLGYPLSDELDADSTNGRYSVFEEGVVYWEPNKGSKIADYIDIPIDAIIDLVDQEVINSDDRLYFTDETELTKVHHWYNYDNHTYRQVIELDYDLAASVRLTNPSVDLQLFLNVEVQDDNLTVTLIREKHHIDYPRWFTGITIGISKIIETIGNNKLGQEIEEQIGQSIPLSSIF